MIKRPIFSPRINAGQQGPQGIPGVTWEGAYNGATAYSIGDAVSYDGSSYICILSSTGNLPTNATYWELVASKGDTGATGAAGADGDDAYVYIAYASDASGTGFTTTFNAARSYIAIKTTTTPIASPAVGDFAGLWFNYKGATGEKGDQGDPGAGVTYSLDSGTADNYAITPSTSPSAYNMGDSYFFYANNTNTGASTINVNSLGNENIKKDNNGIAASDLVAGDIIANRIYLIVYDSVQFQLINLSGGNADTLDNADLSTDGTFASNSDVLIPTEKAVKTYVDANSGDFLVMQVFN